MGMVLPWEDCHTPLTDAQESDQGGQVDPRTNKDTEDFSHLPLPVSQSVTATQLTMNCNSSECFLLDSTELNTRNISLESGDRVLHHQAD